ncbi:MAG: ATP-binding protein [Ilumatobacteraceae bacterium]
MAGPAAVRFTGEYQRRIVDAELDLLMPHLPAILLDGPKGVGKTSTATQRCASERRLDHEATRAVVAADPMLIAADARPLLLDEWHLVRPVWDVVRRLVDADPTGGQFLLTGSLPDRQTHSGAGRITSIRMRPLTLPERGVDVPTVSLASLIAGSTAIGGRTAVGLDTYVDEMLAGGFPGLRHLPSRARNAALDSYIQRIADHDLPDAGHAVRHPSTVMAWLRAYAAAVGTTASWEKIRKASVTATDANPAKSTTLPYIELLTALRLLDPIPGWTPSLNHLRDLTETPKHYLADPALAARLVQRSATQLLSGDVPDTVVARDGGFLGGLFESLAALSVRVFAQHCDAMVHHLRTGGGRHEVDFIVESENGIIAVESKLASTITDRDVQHLLWLRDRLGNRCIDTVVVHTGPEAYRRPDGVAVVPLALLGP